MPVLPAETLLDRTVLKALDDELSGVAMKDHVSRLTQLHRVPASPGFHEAIEYVRDRATAIGLSDVHVETFPGDGNTWFGTLHGNRGWRVEGGTLDEVRPQPRRIISYDDTRLAVADTIDLLADRIAMGHAKDRYADGKFATAGKGVLDYPHYLSRLLAVGFDGPLITHGLTAAEAPGAATFLKRILGEAGIEVTA